VYSVHTEVQRHKNTHIEQNKRDKKPKTLAAGAARNFNIPVLSSSAS
jgi:hypothetical protein